MSFSGENSTTIRELETQKLSPDWNYRVEHFQMEEKFELVIFENVNFNENCLKKNKY